MAPSSCAGVAPLFSYGSASVKGAKGGPSGAGSIAAPHASPIRPPPPSGSLKVGHLTPEPRQTPGLAQARSAPLLRSCHPLWHWQLPQLGQPEDPISASTEVVSRLLTQCPQHAMAYLNLFRRRDKLEGGSGGECKATEGHGPPGHGNVPATPPFTTPPTNSWATTIWVPTVGRHGQVGGLPGWVMR